MSPISGTLPAKVRFMALGLVLFLAIVQGATELFPVSSLGHAVVIPPLLHLGFNQANADFVPLLALLHLGTATALLILYWREWRAVIVGFCTAGVRGRIETPAERMAMLLAVATIPTAVVGFFFEKPLKSLFASPSVAGAFLIVNGALLAGAELLRRRDQRRRVARAADSSALTPVTEASYHDAESLSFRAAALVGLCQVLALFPGISRSGVTMAGGLLAGLRHEQALRFSFLLATPIILGAGLFEIPEISARGPVLVGYIAAAVVGGIVAYISARLLLRYFRNGRLEPFAAYGAALGIITLIVVR